MKVTISHSHFFMLLFGLLLLSVSCSENDSRDSDLRRWEEQASRVGIYRDSFGVPHIYGESDADAVFGLLYAQCEDDYPRVERNYLWAIGRLAEMEGESALFSDLRARMFMTEEEARECYLKSPVWLKRLCDAFADGVNYYLYTHPEVPRNLEQYENWMPFYFFEGSIGGNIESVRTRRIQDFYEDMAVPVTDTVPEAEPAGSNGIAIAPQHSASGNAMLLINPHTSFYFRPEVHVVSREGLNVYGAVTWGQFFVYQGFNEKTGWMHTSGYTDVMDEFMEEIRNEGGKLQYRYGQEWRDVESFRTEIRVKSGDSLLTRKFPVYRTHHGPITSIREGRWTATALMWDPVEALKQSYLRTKQDNFEQFNKVMKIRRNSSNNTVFADKEGNIGYYHGNFVPKRDVRFDYTNPVEGSDPATDWQGLHTVEETITLLNPGSGWIQNCNSTPFTAAGTFSPRPEDYPYYMAPEPETSRGILAVRLLEKVDKIDLDGLIDLAYDPSLPAFELIVPRLLEAFDSRPNSRMKPAIELLRVWDFKTAVDSRAMTLAHYYGNEILRAPRPDTGRGRLNIYRYWGSEEAPVQDCLAAFERALDRLEEDFGTWELPWGEVNRFQRLNGDIRQPFSDSLPSYPVGFASGRWGSLAAYGYNYTNHTRKLYGTRGNSFVAAVEFGEKVKAKSLLAGGQSGDPGSPHFDDQIGRYLAADFKDVLFYREDVEKGSGPMYRPGEPMQLRKSE